MYRRRPEDRQPLVGDALGRWRRDSEPQDLAVLALSLWTISLFMPLLSTCPAFPLRSFAVQLLLPLGWREEVKQNMAIFTDKQ